MAFLIVFFQVLGLLFVLALIVEAVMDARERRKMLNKQPEQPRNPWLASDSDFWKNV